MAQPGWQKLDYFANLKSTNRLISKQGNVVSKSNGENMIMIMTVTIQDDVR